MGLLRHALIRLLSIHIFIFCFNHKLLAIPSIHIEGKVLDSGFLPSRFSGRMIISNWEPAEEGRCLYLPLNDPSFIPGGVSVDYFRYKDMPVDRIGQLRGKISITAEHISLTPYLIRIAGDQSSLEIPFNSKMPQEFGRLRDVFIDNFHPIPLNSCPQTTKPGSQLDYFPSHLISAEITPPLRWQLVIPTIGSSTPIKSSRLSFALVKDYQEKRLFINGLETVIYFKSKSFLDLTETIISSIDSHMEWFGPYPFPRMMIVESTNLQKSDLPGIVPLNIPRQQLFSSIQSQLLNWNHWIATKLLAYQWYGASIRPNTAEDAWLIMGIADFATLSSLRKNSARFNLFNIFDFERFILSLNYLEAQELTTALLANSKPYCPLTNQDGVSIQPAKKQHGYLFLRQAVALRHLSYIAGEQNFQRFLRTFTIEMSGLTLSPQQFRTRIGDIPSPFSSIKRTELSQTLSTWWINGSWPDFEFANIEKKQIQDGRWLSTITIEQNSSIDFPVPVEIRDSIGQSYIGLSSISGPKSHSITFITENEPTSVEIDPNNIFFDFNRFNNSSARPNIVFFPGSARTFSSNAYTVGWFPYPFRRPGETAGIGAQFGVFKYVKSAFIASLETDYKFKNIAYFIEQKESFPEHQIDTTATISENFKGFRVGKLVVSHKTLDIGKLDLKPNFQIRHRSVRGVNSTGIPSAAFGTEIKSGELLGCIYKGSLETEKSIFKTSIGYRRHLGIVQTDCNVMDAFELELRAFRGLVTTNDNDSNTDFLKFHPENLGEARIRLDESNIEPVNDIFSLNADINFPLQIGIPDETMFLGKKMRGRVFYDYGDSFDTRTKFRSFGLGMMLPFGGDFTGVGSIALTRFTALAVLYSSVNSNKNHTPRFVFDISSDL